MTQTHLLTNSRAIVERMFAADFTFMKEGGTQLPLLTNAFHPQVVVLRGFDTHFWNCRHVEAKACWPLLRSENIAGHDEISFDSYLR